MPTPVDRAGLPVKGTSMTDVEKKFGAPATKQPTVGGDTPKHPPITRWDYAGFSVIFEKDKVIDAVIPGTPPPVYHKDQLTPVDSSSAPPPPVPAAAVAEAPAAAPAEAPAAAPAEAAPAPAEAAPPAPAPENPAAPVATPENPNPDRPPTP